MHLSKYLLLLSLVLLYPEISLGQNRVIVFANGWRDCCAWSMNRVEEYAENQGMSLHQVPWVNFSHGDKGYTISTNGSTQRFIDEGKEFFNALPAGTEVFLIGHSWGADSLLSLVENYSRSHIRIRLLAVIDPVSTAGFRNILSQYTVGNHVDYFFNRWQTNQPFPNDFPLSGSISCEAGQCDQRSRNTHKNTDGSDVTRTCEVYEFGCTGRVENPFSYEPGYVKKRVGHQGLATDGFLEQSLIDIIDRLIAESSTIVNRDLLVNFNESKQFSITLASHETSRVNFSVDIEPTDGAVSRIEPGSTDPHTVVYEYVPDPGATGDDFFVIRLEDQGIEFNPINIEYSVQISVNNPPTVRSGSFRIGNNQYLSFSTVASDQDGHAIAGLFIDQQPTNGTVNILSSGVGLEYLPAINDGSDQFRYHAVDEYGASSGPGIINVQIIPPAPRLMTVVKAGVSTGDGTITSSPDGISYPTDVIEEFAFNSTVTLQATPDDNSLFMGWDGACSGSGTSHTCTVTMDAARQVIARFDRAPATYTLDVIRTGNGGGTVESLLPGIACGDDCSEEYAFGLAAQVVLTARADSTSTFIGWGGDCTGKGPCTTYMSQDKRITFEFAESTSRTFVVDNLNDSGTGSLRQAIIDANINPGIDTVTFSPELTGTIVLSSGQLSITDSLNIEGPGAERIAVSGNESSRVFFIDTGENVSVGRVAISALKVSNGFDTTENGGGAILANSGDLRLTDMYLYGNAANSGAGGGAIRKLGGATLIINRSAIINNSAFDRDFLEGSGGGIRVDEGNAEISNSTISGNTAASGGGVYVDTEAVGHLVNVTIAGNNAEFGGGGLFIAGNLELENSIVSSNVAGADNEVQNFGTLSSRYNIIGENGARGVTADTVLSSTDFVLNNAVNSVIRPLADNGGPTPTYMVVDGGPAVDAGAPDFATGEGFTDQRGFGYARVTGEHVDIGALERFRPLVLPDSADVVASGNYIEIRPVDGFPVAVASYDTNKVEVGIDYTTGSILVQGISPGSARLEFQDAEGNSVVMTVHVLENQVTDGQTCAAIKARSGTIVLICF